MSSVTSKFVFTKSANDIIAWQRKQNLDLIRENDLLKLKEADSENLIFYLIISQILLSVALCYIIFVSCR